ncbi:4-hydroxy-tetrahydrodipicolinate synthase [Lysinibacillus sp. FSL H8-0500]|uniref:4-hydroxy-tetrahydrodipicolinate synthase n=1 Tax=Lysinibacillus sp. FSL H8-0500 TaxID=2921393 RepID=UPI003101339B
MYKPTGMIPAVPTPFDVNEQFDKKEYRKLIESLIEAGMHCLLTDGSTGEYSLMSLEERKEVIATACQVADGRVPIMAGTSCARTEDTIALTKFAEEAGADCALIITPYYMKTSEQGIIDYYTAIAESVSIGIVIYHYPGATNVELSPQLIHRLSQIPGIVGVKNTTDQEHTCKVIALVQDNPNFAVLTGYEHLILPTLAVGGDGATGIVHNLIPHEIVKLYNLFKENKIAEAIALNKKLAPLYDYVEQEPSPGPVKAGLEVLGYESVYVRKPLVPTTDELKAKIEGILQELGKLVAK